MNETWTKKFGIWGTVENSGHLVIRRAKKQSRSSGSLQDEKRFFRYTIRYVIFWNRESAKDSWTLGHIWKIVKLIINLDVRKHFLSERVVDRWNKLDQTDWLWKYQRFQEQIGKYSATKDRFLRGLVPASLMASSDWDSTSLPGVATPGK